MVIWDVLPGSDTEIAVVAVGDKLRQACHLHA
jgi:hypothetical protein